MTSRARCRLVPARSVVSAINSARTEPMPTTAAARVGWASRKARQLRLLPRRAGAHAHVCRPAAPHGRARHALLRPYQTESAPASKPSVGAPAVPSVSTGRCSPRTSSPCVQLVAHFHPGATVAVGEDPSHDGRVGVRTTTRSPASRPWLETIQRVVSVAAADARGRGVEAACVADWRRTVRLQ